jgi:LysM repeat protein
MGSVRRANWRPYLYYLALNILVSVVTVLVVLTLWDRRESQPKATPTATADVVAQVASAVPTVTPTPLPSPTPVTYTVRSGDTLYGIALELDVPLEALMDANGLSDTDTLAVGQVLIVPAEGGDASAPPATSVEASGPGTPTPITSSEPIRVQIHGPEHPGDLEREYLRLLNTGGEVSMEGWTLDDGEDHEYQFPDFTFFESGAVLIHTRAGEDTTIDLYWGLEQPVWLPGKVITLRDAQGNIQDTFRIPG